MGLKLLSSIYVEQHFMCTNKFYFLSFQVAHVHEMNIFEEGKKKQIVFYEIYIYFYFFLEDLPGRRHLYVVAW